MEPEDTLSHSRYPTDSNLQRLSDSDFAIAENEPDVRGWDVVLADGRTIGEVDDLLVDTSAMKVRCVDVELDATALGITDDEHALVPIDRVDLDVNGKQIVLRGLDLDAVLKLRGGDSSETRDWQASTPAAASTAAASTSAASTSARLTRSAEELRIGKRMVQAGEVRVGKHIETDQVTETVGRERERVTVERRRAGPGASTSPQFSEDEIVVPVMEEEVIVEKRPVVKEELVISKERVTEQEEVSAELRREEFDIKGGEELIGGRERMSGSGRKGDR
jgi:uncharacterized protein (TIGR02271 family)